MVIIKAGTRIPPRTEPTGMASASLDIVFSFSFKAKIRYTYRLDTYSTNLLKSKQETRLK